MLGLFKKRAATHHDGYDPDKVIDFFLKELDGRSCEHIE